MKILTFILGCLALVSSAMAAAMHNFALDDPHGFPLENAHSFDEESTKPGENILGDMSRYDFLSPDAERNVQFWHNKAFEELKARKKPRILKKAKNIIMFLGDGMSLNTQTAARILQGQRKGKTGEEEYLSFEKFPYTGLSKTYCANAQVPDSACTATAYLGGVKTNIFNIGVTAAVNFNNCSAAMDPRNHVSSLAAWAQAAGKSTGFITTTTLTHASPSGAYAHVANRFWECDADIRKSGVDPSNCMDIAQQLVTQAPGRYFDVVMGGGMGKLLPNTMIDKHGNPGEREDGKNLMSQWQARHPGGVVVTNRKELLFCNTSSHIPSSMMGVFQSGVMKYHLDADAEYQPTLQEMCEVTKRIVERNDKGYFLFIEGGLIDYGNHYNSPARSLDETLEFAKAIEWFRANTDPEETLIVVTADHAHPLSISGYPGRGNDILNLNQYDQDVNGIKYATLNYAVGMQQYLDEHGERIDLTDQIGDKNFTFPSYVKAKIGVHGGDDVGVFSSGPQAHLFTGSMEQHLIPHLMAYAACIGEGPTMCDE